MDGIDQQGLARYKKELKEYKEWSDNVKEQYGEERLKEYGVMGLLDGADYDKLMRWNAELGAMERVLGLSKAQIKAISEEIGLKL